uniref:RNA polymerase sigma factor rpoD2 n=1 Tax=Anthurium amnicola TaxID=1678845 RepID=A0A1D1XG44_9ARAE
MMATAAVVGLTTGKRLLSSSFCPDLTEKLFYCPDHGQGQFSAASMKNMIFAKRTPNFTQNTPGNRHPPAIKALKEYVDAPASTAVPWFHTSYVSDKDGKADAESSLELLLLLQKSMLEKQWDLSYDQTWIMSPGDSFKQPEITRSGISARQRRTSKRYLGQSFVALSGRKQPGPTVSPELLQSRLRGYVRGRVSEDLLSHVEVVNLSQKIKAGLLLEEHKSKLREKLGHEPSEKQLASSLRMSCAELHSKMMEYSLAREKLAMSNVRLVRSIAQKYDNMGAEMADLVQGGLIGLLRGIEKFDSSKGFKISTYVYWWIRQGVSRTLVENSKILRLPSHLHERLSSIRNARIRLEDGGVAPSIDKIAECLNMSTKKVRNATQAVSKVYSLDREAFPSLNGLPNETLHSYFADNHLENIPWHGVDEWFLKEEVNRLLCTTLSVRERDIIGLYYGLENKSYSWEDISRQIGLSRERVRQVGLVALEKLKRAARKRGLDAMVVKH